MTGQSPNPFKIAGRRDIDIDALSDEQLSDIGRDLYPVHARIFSGVSQGEFESYVLHSGARENRLRLFLNPAGETVGYCAVHFHDRKVDGRPARVMRAETGLLPDYRGKGASFWFMQQAWRYKRRHPFTRLFYLGSVIHPSSYHLLAKYFPAIYPTAANEGHPRLQARALQLAADFDLPAPREAANPLVRPVRWITREETGPVDPALAGRVDVKFFSERNPNHGQGLGLIVVIPMTFAVFARAFRGPLTAILLKRLGIRRRKRR